MKVKHGPELNKPTNSQSNSMQLPVYEKRDPRTRYFFESPDKVGGPSDPLIQFRGVFNQIFNSESSKFKDARKIDKSKLTFKNIGYINCP